MKFYRELQPIREGKRKYRFITMTIDSLPLHGKMRHHRDCVMRDSREIIRAWIANARLYWNPGYAWNGSSPKRYVGFPPIGFWAGTPDFEPTRKPSLGHDILFQFAGHGEYNFDDANYCFLKWMETNGFHLAENYFDAVDMFGERFWTKDETLTITYL